MKSLFPFSFAKYNTDLFILLLFIFINLSKVFWSVSISIVIGRVSDYNFYVDVIASSLERLVFPIVLFIYRGRRGGVSQDKLHVSKSIAGFTNADVSSRFIFM